MVKGEENPYWGSRYQHLIGDRDHDGAIPMSKQGRPESAIFLVPRRARHPKETAAEPAINKAPRIAQAKALQHEVTRRGPYLECQRCGQFWLSRRVDILAELGPCPGHTVYGKPERDRPWVIPSGGKAIRWGKQTLHRTHQTKWLRGIMYCTECGAYSTSGHTFRRLRAPCEPKPNSQYTLQTNRLHEGKLRPGLKN